MKIRASQGQRIISPSEKKTKRVKKLSFAIQIQPPQKPRSLTGRVRVLESQGNKWQRIALSYLLQQKG